MSNYSTDVWVIMWNVERIDRNVQNYSRQKITCKNVAWIETTLIETRIDRTFISMYYLLKNIWLHNEQELFENDEKIYANLLAIKKKGRTKMRNLV